MRRKRVTGRFYVFVALVLIGGYFVLRELLPEAAKEAVVTLANATYKQTVDAVIVRDEDVATYEGSGRVVFVANEGAAVRAGDEICQVYTSSYAEKEMLKLESVRQSIRSYHETILDNIVDAPLEKLEKAVEDAALRVKTFVERKSGGSLLTLQQQLETAMIARQDYLRQNRRQDHKLNQLYEEETKRLGNIESWKITQTAARDGVVSFYLDGCETFLTVDNLGSISVDDLRAILAGKTPQTSISRLNTPVYRLVSTEKWYVILLSEDVTWNPVSGQVFTFQMQGYDDVAFTGTVVQMQKTADHVVAQLEVLGTPGPLMNERYGKADIGVYLSGLSVPVNAITTQAAQTGVMLSDMAGGTFIPVEVLSTDDRYALVQPLVEGTLYVGQRVLLQ